jgi:hypothetical protein
MSASSDTVLNNIHKKKKNPQKISKWLEHLVKIATVLGSILHPPTHWNIRAADEAVLNKVYQNISYSQLSLEQDKIYSFLFNFKSTLLKYHPARNVSDKKA